MKRFALVVSLASSACLGVIDGGSNDPGMDDDPMDLPPPPTDVSIKVHDSAGPLADIAVVFMDGSDAVVADVKTDAQGAATAKLPSGGSVSVIRAGAMSTLPGETPAAVYTYVGVEGGDKLDLMLPAQRESMPRTVTVTVAENEDEPGAVVQVMTPCGSGAGVAPSITVTLDGCGTETDFYVTEIGEGTASFVKRATIADTIDLSGEMFRGELATTFSVKNVPTGATVTIEKRLDTDLYRPVFSTGAVAVTPDAPTEVNVADLPGTEEQVLATVIYGEGAAIIATHDAYAASPALVDLANAMIAVPTTPTLTGDTLSWTETGSGAPDTVVAQLRNERVVRYVAAPYASTSVKIPRLPAAHDAFNLTPTDTTGIALAKVSGGYDAARPHVFSGAMAPMGGSATITVAGGIADPQQ